MRRLVLLGIVLMAAAPQGQYTVATDTVTDTKTLLVWQRATPPSMYTWTAALQYCEGLTLAGQSDWRLPTVKELNSLVEDRATPPKIDPVAFPSTPSTTFWTSSPFAQGGGYVQTLSFATATTSYAGTNGSYAVRCVSGG